MKTAFGFEHEDLAVYKSSPSHCTDEVCTNPVLNPHPSCTPSQPIPATVVSENHKELICFITTSKLVSGKFQSNKSFQIALLSKNVKPCGQP